MRRHQGLVAHVIAIGRANGLARGPSVVRPVPRRHRRFCGSDPGAGLADPPMTNGLAVAKIWVARLDGGRTWIACGRSTIGSTISRATLVRWARCSQLVSIGCWVHVRGVSYIEPTP